MMDYKEFINSLSDTNATLSYFTDFKKITDKISKIEIKLHQLNYLIGKRDLRKAVYELFNENPSVFDVLNILIAVRDKNKKVVNDEGNIVFLKNYFENPESIYKYLKETGLEEVFIREDIKNVVDYVFGIEVGLDTNARKNRSGKIMAKIVENIFEKNGIKFSKEIKSDLFPEIMNLGYDLKCFDYVVQTTEKCYLIETNYYNVGGSKINETTRAYIEIAKKINEYKNYEFVWITDGKSWLSAKNKIKEAFQHIKHIYNLKTIKRFIEILKEEI
ncbi:restriction endonuclease MboI [Thermosipho melanesiensis]|nr:restriction endonuclease MboI [Thermosipho melanesiensis]